jgi:predicted nucleic acid-binding protein
MTFVDSNVFIYAIDKTVSPKQATARRIVAEAFGAHAPYRISAQVLAEFAIVSIRKLKLATPLLLEFLSEMGRISRTDVDNALVCRAAEIQGIYGIQFYDAQIVAAAERLGCNRILTEDLNDGQMYCGIIAVNPFSHGGHEMSISTFRDR